jgi:APA family basic amino acid/polyamine antiporter
VALSVWVIGGLLSLLGALAYAELGCMRTGTGGLYAYIRDAFGPVVAFTYGWALFVVIGTGSVATLAVATGDNMNALFPIGPVAKKVLAVAVIAILAFINIRGTKKSATILAIGTVLKFLALLFLIIALPLVGHGFSQVEHAWPTDWNSVVMSGALVGMISVLWAYEGWQYATFVGGEVVNPQKNFPRGLILGTLAIIVVYVLTNVGYVAGLGPAALAESQTVASDAVGAAFGPTAGRLIAIPVLISVVSAAHGLLLSGSRAFFAMAQDGVFFKKMAEVHPKFGTPAFAIIAMSVWSAILALSGTFTILLTYVVFVGWIFYGLGGLCVIAFRRKDPDAPRPFKVPGYPVTPILFVIAALVIVVNTVVNDPLKGVIGIGGSLIAVPIYYLWKRRPA